MTNDLPTWIDIDPPERPPHPNPVYIGPAMYAWLEDRGYDMHQYEIAPMMPVEYPAGSIYTRLLTNPPPFYQTLRYKR